MRLSDISNMPEDPPVTMARLAEVSYPEAPEVSPC